MKSTATAVDIVSDVLENSHWNVCSEFLSKLSPANIGFASYSRLKFFLRFQNTEAAF